MYVVGPKKLEKWNPTKNSDKLLDKTGDIPATTWAQRFYKWVVEYGSKPEGFVWKWQILVGQWGLYTVFFWYLTRKLRTNTNHFWGYSGISGGYNQPSSYDMGVSENGAYPQTWRCQ